MERAEGSAEKAEISWEKLRRVGKRGGNSTPSASFWRINELGLSAKLLMFDATNFSQGRIISSRKLAAALWELHPYNYKLPLDNPPPPRLRRADEDVGGSESLHHRFHRIAPCNPATASTSTALEAQNGLKTSTKLLKVLNRVWSLEEQQVSSISLIKGLKKELDRARFRAEELSGGELLRKNKEHDRINARFQSIRDELRNERKLKNSKSLQRKLAQELCEVKSSLVSISKELEGERMSRVLLEELCDELAWGLRDYEKEMHDLKQKSDKDLDERDDHDQLILRIAQAWLDERRNVVENKPTIQNPSSQNEGSFQNERTSEEKINGNLMLGSPLFRKGSLKSIPQNYGASTRREKDDDNEDGSSSSHSNCFQVEETNESNLKLHRHEIQESHFEEMMKQKQLKEKLESSEWSIELSPSIYGPSNVKWYKQKSD